MPLLQLNNVSIAFHGADKPFEAVKSLSFSLKTGESLAIVGESGSGKSVSMRAIMGLLDPLSLAGIRGEAWLESEKGRVNLLADKTNWTDIRGRELAMIFQEPMTALNPVMRCGDQVTEVIRRHSRRNKKEVREHLEQLFTEVQLPDIPRMIRSYPHELSGGQRQRVMIAMALAANPKVLIADEPTTALDVSVQASILKLLRKLQLERGMALVFISHDLGVVREIADRTLVMYRGREMEQGETEHLFRAPKHIYTRALIACRPTANLHGRLPVMSDFFEVGPDGELIEKTADRQEPVTEPETPEAKEVLVRVKDLQVSYRSENLWGKASDNPVIEHLDLEIHRGETLGVLGESGSGKSTTGRAILQLIRYSGEVWMGDIRLFPAGQRGRKALARRIQLIYQDPYSSLNPRYRISQAFLEICATHGIPYGEEKGKGLLRKVGLDDDAWNKYPHEFSGGQRQRIAIARALLVDPEFIVCDEAVSALDVSVQAQVLNLLKELQKELGLSYLFITHDLAVARYICDRILVLNKGRVVEIKPTTELFAQPENEYTRKLLSAYRDIG